MPDSAPLPGRVTAEYRHPVSQYYRFRRGDRVVILSGKHSGAAGVVDSAVFQRTVDWPGQFAPGYHVLLGDGRAVTVRWDQVERLGPE